MTLFFRDAHRHYEVCGTRNLRLVAPETAVAALSKLPLIASMIDGMLVDIEE